MFLLTSCWKNPVENVYIHLEKAVELEEPFEAQQKPLQEAERKENELFTSLIHLQLEDREKIEQLVMEVMESIDLREQLVEMEKESMDSSFEHMSEIDKHLSRLKEPLLSKAEALVSLQKERYEAYLGLYDVYKQAIRDDRILFQMFTDEDVSLHDLQQQINIVNHLYEKINEKKERFNELTIKYNKEKRLFYEAAELDIQYE